ncbi:hypothetical protein ACWFR5_15850 [Streptomyces sp. NPDC055092]
MLATARMLGRDGWHGRWESQLVEGGALGIAVQLAVSPEILMPEQ